LCVEQAQPHTHIDPSNWNKDPTQSSESIAEMTSSSHIKVLLQSISGEELEIPMAADATMHDLKGQISELWSMPIPFQVLVADTRPVNDSEGLAACGLSDNGALTVMAFLSTDSIAAATSALSRPEIAKEIKLETVQNLGMLGPKYADDVITAVSTLFDHQDAELRLAAWTCITQIAGRGNSRAIEVVTEQLHNASLRQVAMWAFGQIAEIGDPHAIECLISLLHDEDVDVCMLALETLGKFAGKGHRQAIIAVSQCLTDEGWRVRCRAVEALQQVLCGISHGISCAKALQNHPNKHVRWAATEALGQFTDRCEGL